MNCSAVIRIANSADLVAIRECAVGAYEQYIERIGREPAPMVADFAASINREQCYIIEIKRKVGGFVVFYPKVDHIHLENVAIHPDAQKQGLGSQLIYYVELEAKKAGFDRIELYTNAMMTENLGIYPRLGYEQFDRRHEDGFDRVYFRKYL